ncbi:LolA-like outer membrane lipoprotein chaperone [Helicobacter sp. MIT 99-5507]|uniref:LolA-like outer membrane lipoprotein chaperone n=1 Tax=Helicobacter sp. MIT 99-5507 TaxID=152489 RepID=UPI000E1FADE1|nr:LolA-like outer membrane lipoprotein chaperone [Helicobacter sp. MIT 99-5507]RDU58249.1 hypothetical protein CQA42_00110 [Helicobacter sp. MIT 99-5507]
MRILVYLFFIINICFSFDLKSINNIKADFVQIITTSDNNKIEYSGNSVTTKGYKSYYKYTKPFEKEVFIDEKQTIVYEPNLNQAIIFTSGIGLVDILNNAKQDGDKIISHANNITFFIYLDSNDMPKKIEYTDTLDNKNEIILSNIKINTNIDDSIFVFNAPKGTDIIYSKSNTF